MALVKPSAVQQCEKLATTTSKVADNIGPIPRGGAMNTVTWPPADDSVANAALGMVWPGLSVLSVDDDTLSHNLAFDLVRRAAKAGKTALIRTKDMTNEQRLGVLEALKAAGDHGLDPARYAIADLESRIDSRNPEILAEFELLMSDVPMSPVTTFPACRATRSST